LKLSYYTDHPNFGDALNPLLAGPLFGDIIDQDQRHPLLFIGTVIERHAEEGCDETILGAGAGYQSGAYSLERREVYCVRGPLTCDLLGIDRSFAAIDPAILTSRIYASTSASSTGCLFMPHHLTHSCAGGHLRAICETVGIHYVSPTDDPETIISTIAGADRIITEALHGAVVAESYNVPWIPVVFGSKVLAKKWQDFAASIGGDYQPVEIHTNIAFDGKVRLADRIKYAGSKVGLAKPKHKYLPVRKPTVSALALLENRLRLLKSADVGMTSSAAVKAASIDRLDAAISSFLQAHRCRGGRRTGS
jgi:succinoglycan biosynthesis protein ExoV